MKFKTILVICTLALAAVAFLFSPLFRIDESALVIEGYTAVSRAEILNRLEIDSRTNLLFFNTVEARRRIMQNLYVDDVSFRRELPNRLHVRVQERRLSAYVEDTPGNFLFIDENGRVLDARTFFTEPKPIVMGLNFTRFALGELLEVDNPAAFFTVVQYAQLLNRYELTERAARIDVSDIENTRIMIYNIEFNVGDIMQADEKVRTIVEILSVLPNADRISGFVDLREIRSQYSFQILT